MLCRNRLRQKVTLETDGKLMTGHDVAVALLLGAEEFGFATAPLITMGCRMMRVCHLGTCPFGIATQNPALRKRFAGKPEYIERFMLFIAEQLREIMAKLGARTVNELVGRGDLLKMKPDAALDLSDLIGFSRNTHFQPEAKHDFHLNERTDARLFQQHVTLTTTDRAFGTLLKGSRTVQAQGCGGQSFGAFIPKESTSPVRRGQRFVGKGLYGGSIAVCPTVTACGFRKIPSSATWPCTGPPALRVHRGMAGERFACAIPGLGQGRGVGDHGCEYMTGGRGAVLGPVGDNFAAGMSGGVAWVLDENGKLKERLNTGHVKICPVSPEQAGELQRLLQMHEKATGSRKAKEILRDFDAWLPRFRAVISDEYLAYLKGA